MDDLTTKQAMNIILFAGDARVNCKNALVATEKNDFATAQAEMKLAKKNITEAHKIQTEAIQNEMREEEVEHKPSLLFTHAQDTLMTIYSEINITNHLVKIAEKVDTRLTSLEAKK
ncbi:PTS lactose/cellobiose transporter subunit IIA [Carnobacterium gallinarum]|uniref:PTS lactose/cellobiose transporter subunit IIA n=1 Tax=Carnobacterium gallinarum TaxID=2749 RepID=UPI00054D698B|nr:PTS lactose/cellobiose transporter subunit IIA [Carnobacterium gallinarum]